MARKDDSARDTPARRLLEQLNTYTVGTPPGLTGDSIPDTVFDADNFGNIKNQMNLQLTNLEAFNMLNTLGQITNTQSQSGPVPMTGVIKTTGALTATTKVTVFQPDPGEVWEIMAMSMDPNGAGQAYRGIGSLNDGTNSVELFDISGTGEAEAVTTWDHPIYIDHTMYLSFYPVTIGTNLALKAAVIRVR